MKSVTEKIFYNEAGQIQRAPKNAEYQKCKEEYCALHDKLDSTLNDEQSKLLDELFLSMGAVQSVMEELYFRKGLATGLRLGFEACSETDVLDTNEL